jgi:hypothetical protein
VFIHFLNNQDIAKRGAILTGFVSVLGLSAHPGAGTGRAATLVSTSKVGVAYSVSPGLLVSNTRGSPYPPDAFNVNPNGENPLVSAGQFCAVGGF